MSHSVKIYDTCIGCTQCVRACPTDVLEMIPWDGCKAKQIASAPRTEDCVGSTVSEEDIPQPLTVPKDKLLGGLLPTGFDETSCLSRYESFLYNKPLQHKPSSYLISGLRRYEALHKQCGPYTELYNKTVDLIKSGEYSSDSSVCNYVVWISYSGLGNRILTLTSAFLYALLTNRVLLVDPRVNLPDLFCEPFPEVSWLLPPDFPIIDQFSSFNQKSPHSYGYMMRNNVNLNEPIVNSSGKTKTISVLTTSLNPRYFEEIRNIYWENPTVTGEIVSIFQPSHEEHQQTEKLMHDRKAWAEMYLLSLSDKLVTSAWSTFGYVAQGLGRFEAMDFIQV
ncbi:hypothetical protein RND71_017489 [Anisodus tanguticus]|uniref:Fucosyltransferase n=1 Tax=Anisodus tanguticus TaxID=243964 RepID=A0AAE1S2B7_9SOLA|nr:hypothetical protein RND71_017489 [Anisodus tanguticus]